MSTQIGATNVLTGKLALGCVTFGRESAQRNRTAAWITPSNMHRLDRHRERTANPKCLASFFECRRHLAAGIVEKPIRPGSVHTPESVDRLQKRGHPDASLNHRVKHFPGQAAPLDEAVTNE